MRGMETRLCEDDLITIAESTDGWSGSDIEVHICIYIYIFIYRYMQKYVYTYTYLDKQVCKNRFKHTCLNIYV
jgi:hypothetical protein